MSTIAEPGAFLAREQDASATHVTPAAQDRPSPDDVPAPAPTAAPEVPVPNGAATPLRT